MGEGDQMKATKKVQNRCGETRPGRRARDSLGSHLGLRLYDRVSADHGHIKKRRGGGVELKSD